MLCFCLEEHVYFTNQHKQISSFNLTDPPKLTTQNILSKIPKDLFRASPEIVINYKRMGWELERTF